MGREGSWASILVTLEILSLLYIPLELHVNELVVQLSITETAAFYLVVIFKMSPPKGVSFPRIPWSDAEESRLLDLMKKHKRKWKAIADEDADGEKLLVLRDEVRVSLWCLGEPVRNEFWPQCPCHVSCFLEVPCCLDPSGFACAGPSKLDKCQPFCAYRTSYEGSLMRCVGKVS